VPENQKGRDHLENLVVDRVLLKKIWLEAVNCIDLAQVRDQQRALAK